jgi:hypothetical protein
MADKVKKAHGHIIQADWNQTDPLQMDYIHNKPEIPDISAIPAANINFTDGGGFSCPAQDAYNYALNEGKGSLPVTVSDISSMLNNFDINLSGIKQAMYYGSGAFDESGCYGVLPIPTASDLQTFSDLPLFAKNKPTSIPIRNEYGNIDVALTPVEEANAASKYYVDRYQKKISNRDCTVINVESTFGVNVWEAPSGYDGGYGLIFYDFYIPITIPSECIGREVTFSVDASISSVELTNNYASSSNSGGSSYTPTEMVGLVSGKNETFWPSSDNCLAYNENNGWELRNYTFVPTSTMMYLCIVEPNAGIPENWKDDFIYKYSTYLKLNISCREFTENGTPVHDTYLHSDTEIHLKDPIESLFIEDLVRCYPENIAQEWTISFITGNNLPSVTIPNNTTIPVRHAYLEDVYDSDYNIIGQKEKFEYVNESLPIKWLYAEPVFEANHKYLITFKQIINTIYGVWTVLE